MLPHPPAVFASRRYSYGAVLAAVGLELLSPVVARWVLVPLLAVGLVGLGIAHGACDQLVLPGVRPSVALRSGRYWAWFLSGYLGLASVVLGLWWYWPALSVGLFFLLTIWHWGSADAPASSAARGAAGWLSHSLLRGMLVFAVPAWRWPAETLGIINGLLTFAGGRPVTAAVFGSVAAGLGGAVGLGQLALWLVYGRQGRWRALGDDAREVALLTALFAVLPPMLSLGVYFVFWHSLQHVLRLLPLLGYAAPNPDAAPVGPQLAARELRRQLVFFLRQSVPLLLLSCLALLALGYALAGRLHDGAAWFSLALVVASVVTLPHALLVTLVLDAARWQAPAPGPRTLRGQPEAAV